jgi:hypothetical protein
MPDRLRFIYLSPFSVLQLPVILLVNPPLLAPSEPPPGLARLAGALKGEGMACQVIDANIEGILHLLGGGIASNDTWSRRAGKNLARNLQSVREIATYANLGRYTRSISDLNRALAQSVENGAIRISLNDYKDAMLSPVRSADLKTAAEYPQRNPFYDYFSWRLAEAVEYGCPSIIGFSVNYLSQALSAFSMVGFLRTTFPAISIVLGGGLITSWMRRPDWRNPFEGLVDELIAGPGEQPLLRLAGAGASPQAFFAPDYTPFRENRYFSPGLILPFSASFGCYWSRCSFCPERAEQNPFVPLQPAQAAQELSDLVGLHAPSLVHLTDNALSPSFLKHLIANPPGAPWYGFVRFTDDLIGLDFCMALRRAGCVMLKLGLESGSQKVLDGMAKGIHLEKASLALRNLRSAGIATYVYLLFGTPYESLPEALSTLDFVCGHHEEVTFLNVAIFNLPLHAPDASELSTRPFYEGDLSLYSDFVHPKGWNRGIVRRFIDRDFRRNPIVQEILRRDPPVFTSLHAPFFCHGKIRTGLEAGELPD